MPNNLAICEIFYYMNNGDYMRQINDYGFAKIKQWEGLRLEAYQDSAGVWTIGYGHIDGVKKGDKITKKQAKDFLHKDLSKFEEVVSKSIKVPLNDYQFAALVSFAFNVGEYAFKKSTLVKKLNKGDYDCVPIELARWCYSGGKKVRGLINRRSAEAGLWVTKAYVSSNHIDAEEPVAEKLYKTGEARGTLAAGVGVLGSASMDFAYQLEPLAHKFDFLRYLFFLLMLGGILVSLWATMKRLQRR